mmetsp:Transcript_56132/g.93207  ORF Transcript_56132/g.93207 Transcript_56132/m.93207 type:complete len:213 (+) Transcript_56132:99-737(+)
MADGTGLIRFLTKLSPLPDNRGMPDANGARLDTNCSGLTASHSRLDRNRSVLSADKKGYRPTSSRQSLTAFCRSSSTIAPLTTPSADPPSGLCPLEYLDGPQYRAASQMSSMSVASRASGRSRPVAPLLGLQTDPSAAPALLPPPAPQVLGLAPPPAAGQPQAPLRSCGRCHTGPPRTGPACLHGSWTRCHTQRCAAAPPRAPHPPHRMTHR